MHPGKNGECPSESGINDAMALHLELNPDQGPQPSVLTGLHKFYNGNSSDYFTVLMREWIPTLLIPTHTSLLFGRHPVWNLTSPEGIIRDEKSVY